MRATLNETFYILLDINLCQSNFSVLSSLPKWQGRSHKISPRGPLDTWTMTMTNTFLSSCSTSGLSVSSPASRTLAETPTGHTGLRSAPYMLSKMLQQPRRLSSFARISSGIKCLILGVSLLHFSWRKVLPSIIRQTFNAKVQHHLPFEEVMWQDLINK